MTGNGAAPAGEPQPISPLRILPEERVHLRAQQFARAQVAQIRLHQAREVQRGRSQSDLYGCLTREIDALREAFGRKFLTASPTMIDYVHSELLRTLAHDDPALLGPGYPGALA
jgi:hypothetical protein